VRQAEPGAAELSPPPLSSYVAGGATGGAVGGLFIGSLIGAAGSWLAGAAIEWMHQLSFTTGVEAQLLPFGDRLGSLEWIRDHWYLVIPLSAIAVAALGAIIGAAVAAAVAALFSRLGRRRIVYLEQKSHRRARSSRTPRDRAEGDVTPPDQRRFRRR
jgi:hypothetical protein